MRMVEVGVVVGEPQRQPLEHRRRDLGRRQPPLLAGVAEEERLVEPAAHELQRLLLEVARLDDRGVGLLGDEGACLVGTECGLEELVDGEEVDRQQVDPAVHRGPDAMVVRHHRAEPVDVGPHPLVARVEDVRPVPVDHHLGLGVTLGVTVAGDMIPGLEDDRVVPCLGDRAGDHRAGEPGSGDAEPHRAASRSSRGGRRAEILSTFGGVRLLHLTNPNHVGAPQ